MTFTINSVDYGPHIIAGTYDVAREREYDTWEDGAKKEHHEYVRSRIEGSFDMYLPEETAYNAFKAASEPVSGSLGVSVTLTVNGEASAATATCMITSRPKRNRSQSGTDFVDIFTVSIREE